MTSSTPRTRSVGATRGPVLTLSAGLVAATLGETATLPALEEATTDGGTMRLPGLDEATAEGALNEPLGVTRDCGCGVIASGTVFSAGDVTLDIEAGSTGATGGVSVAVDSVISLAGSVARLFGKRGETTRGLGALTPPVATPLT